MQFHYVAAQVDGKIIEGDVEAVNEGEVLLYLSRKSLKPVSVDSINKTEARTRALFAGKVTLTDQIFISKYLALMLKIGTGLIEAINILIEDFHKPAVKSLLLEIHTTLEEGKPFYTTFERHPRIFSSVYTNLVRAGEASGNLERTFEDLTGMLSRQKELHDRLRSALAYPVLLIIGAITILSFIITFALPKLAEVFSEGGFDPPGFSKVVFSVGLFFHGAGFFVLIGLIAIVISTIIGYKTSLTFRRFLISLVGEIPVLRDVIKKIALQRFASTLSSLFKAGISITEGLEITARAVGNIELEDALRRISKEGVAKGLTVGAAFRRETFFPSTVTNLIAISEKAGHLSDVLDTLSDFYTKEIDSSVKTLVSFLEPALLLFIGAVIGVIALSVVIPIYQLTTQF